MTSPNFEGELRQGLRFWLRLSGGVMALDAIAFGLFPARSVTPAYGYSFFFLPTRVWGALFALGALACVYVVHRRPRGGVLRGLLLGQFIAYAIFSISILRTTLKVNDVTALPGVDKWGLWRLPQDGCSGTPSTSRPSRPSKARMVKSA